MIRHGSVTRTRGRVAALVGAAVAAAGLSSAPAFALKPRPRSDYARAQTYNFAPASRTVCPVAVLGSSGQVIHRSALLRGRVTRLRGNHAMVILDFGREVGGVASITFAGASDTKQSVGVAFAESSKYAGPVSDNSMGGKTDGYAPAPAARGTYTLPRQFLRGGFRYLAVFLTSAGWVDISRVSLHFTPAPDLGARPNAYPDYFQSSDPLAGPHSSVHLL